ncbi:response regulator [Bryobacter aggregatus]|uniref:response regulator n=1 Tax=Bryobacter aggregatus TaxID=360054 RepID=UPI0004E21798|nr:response regulator [Bryobacter aggregatus]
MQSEEMLEKYRLLLMATDDAIYDYDFRANQIAWNENINLFGYALSEVESGLEWWAERIHPEDRDRVLQLMDAALRGDSSRFCCTYLFRCRDGHYRYVSDHGSVLRDEEEQPVRLVGAMKDVHLVQQMFEHHPQPMWVSQRETQRLLAVNQAALRFYGYSEAEFLTLSIPAIWPPEAVPLAAVNGAPDQAKKEIWTHLTKDGRTLFVEVQMEDLEWNGQPARVALLQDLTRVVNMEAQVRQNGTDQVFELIVSSIAHEFNNLLTVINGYAGITRKQLHSTDPLCAGVEAIRIAGEKAEELTRQLLVLGRKLPTLSRVVQVNDVIERLQSLLPRMVPPEVQIEYRLETGLGEVKVDPLQLERFLLDIVATALGSGGGAKSIFIATTHAAKDAVRITVQDDGSGRDRAMAPMAAAAAMGARLQVEEAEGSGRRLHIEFPRVETGESKSLANGTARGRGRRILLLAEDLAARELAQATLDATGNSVVAADGDAVALACAADPTQTFDLLVTDRMREDSPVVAEIRSLQPGLPVIYLSRPDALAEDSLGHREHFLPLPLQTDDLAGLCVDVLEQRQLPVTVLVVDDDHSVRRLIVDTLGRAGYIAIEASNGLEALRRLESRPIDVMVTDLVMPEREGLETIQLVRKRYPKMPVVAVSGAFSGQFLGLAKVFGACAVLTKPLDLDLFLEEVRRVSG